MTDTSKGRIPPREELSELVHLPVDDRQEKTDSVAGQPVGLDDETVIAPRQSRRHWRAVIAGVVGVTVLAVVAGGVGFAVAGQTVVSDSDDLESFDSTAAVTRGDVAVETRTAGALEFEGQTTLFGGPAGVITSLPSTGDVISAGQPLYTVNARPLALLNGSLPAWRDFAVGMDNGADVRQLEENLVAFGVLSEPANDEFTDKTAAAVRAWQKSTGVPVTGTVARTDIVFLPHPIRVGAIETQVGQQVGGGSTIMAISSASKVVNVDLKVTQRGLAQIDAPVTITLPDGRSVPGTVTHIGVAVERAIKNGELTTVIPVSVTIADQEATNGMDQGGVQVLFTTASSKDVLTVPIEALVPITDSTFGVEVPDKSTKVGVRRIPVSVGVIGAGRVEISGEGIDEGVAVVVPEAVSGS